ncbi:MAG TPA: hypothetical protein VIH99_01000 [Bdellovibrionota bacterium]|jgi:hypothetical protein
MLLTLLFFCILPPPVLADRPDKEVRPPRCNMGFVNSCIEEYRIEAQKARAFAASLSPKVAALAAQLEPLAESRDSHQHKLSLLRSELGVLASEIRFLESPSLVESTPLLPGFPSLEDLFALHPLQKSWHEHYPQERAQKLSTRLREAKAEETDLGTRFEKISGEIERLNNEYQSVQGQWNNLMAAAERHDAMCREGCLERGCPTRN